MDLLKSILEGVELALQHGAALSLFLGLFISLAGTQYIKKLEMFPSKSTWIRALALPLGFFPTYFTWPVHEFNAVRVFLALAVGLGAPLIYKGVVALVRVKWPAIRKQLERRTRRVNWQLAGWLALVFSAGVAVGFYLAHDRECVCSCKVATHATCNWPEGIGIIS